MSLKHLLKQEKSLQTIKLKNRNLSALSPLLKKGGVHDKDNPKTHHKRERKAMKLSLQKQQWQT